MRVHIIQRYDDTMKEKGEEEGERKERDIYVKSTGDPLLSAVLFL